MGDNSGKRSSKQSRLPSPPTPITLPAGSQRKLFSDAEKAILQSSWEEFRACIEIVGIKHSFNLDIFGHEDTEGIFAASGGPLRNTEQGRVERDGWLPPKVFRKKAIILFDGKGNVPFSLVKWGAHSVTVAETDPVIRIWQRAKMLYGGSPEVRSIFSSRSIPFKSKYEYLDYLRPILHRVLDDAPPEPYLNYEAIGFLDRDLFDSKEPEHHYDLLIAHDMFGVPGGLTSELEFEIAFKNLLRYRAKTGSILIYPADYAEDLAEYSGDSFFPWLRDQDLASHGLELAPPDQFERIILARITFLPDVLYQ